jgi:hypothetical protein
MIAYIRFAQRLPLFSEDWTQKGKFPPSLKPALARAALLAVELDEYDEYFFNYMPTIFPYNKFTMSVSPLPPPP